MNILKRYNVIPTSAKVVGFEGVEESQKYRDGIYSYIHFIFIGTHSFASLRSPLAAGRTPKAWVEKAKKKFIIIAPLRLSACLPVGRVKKV